MTSVVQIEIQRRHTRTEVAQALGVQQFSDACGGAAVGHKSLIKAFFADLFGEQSRGRHTVIVIKSQTQLVIGEFNDAFIARLTAAAGRLF